MILAARRSRGVNANLVRIRSFEASCKDAGRERREGDRRERCYEALAGLLCISLTVRELSQVGHEGPFVRRYQMAGHGTMAAIWSVGGIGLRVEQVIDNTSSRTTASHECIRLT